ncbi:hypothetical protein SEA_WAMBURGRXPRESS_29 [Mycobacterium phage Wamburgrxpress]|uniref:Uncharacterized protein n=3 Tax=Bronvirus TaxID=1623278 RepID=E0YPG2_9CAUD|nr:hypothetical protein LEBRON_29 [Mycobacterium phage LeBron]ADL70996.1 hypothetical protein LEBRON_29 [Mycobacterium phage LeBron]AEK07573.1 hypothetical protein UPIE_29 [Mycobacterium phage UPIE]AYD82209.1 hypothetical protein SEA_WAMBURGRXPRESS_29 [Mycobacterium phage Wamburgrxpress]
MDPSDMAVAIARDWPDLAVVASLLCGLYVIVRYLAGTFESVSRALGPVGRWFRSRRAINKAELMDMQKRVEYLDERVTRLLYRDQCYFAYVLADTEWHRRHEIKAAALGWDLERHVSFIEFRDRWMRNRGLDKELDIWK